ncbi:LOB domain-containing protein 36 [Lactuca sativa]|uniref:LOB domain-containing protein 36 n=1 Tax=Lactuca sativa TaxID=4236 RepID=UPI000CB09878|nr:LOB domain-containing protein 36 [Lactuca sativa]XP_023733881.1 LOB domain-containing protein 36 [Lactuca sativa]
MSSSNSPCAACKFLRRKCTQECVFAPYFPPDHPQKFANVHKVFGASNVAKILNELNTTQREDAVNSLAYEAEARLRDPVYGCVGLISVLQHRLKQVQSDLHNAKLELSNYIGPSAMLPILNPGFIPQIGNMPTSSSVPVLPYNMQPIFRDAQPQHHQQILEAQQQQLVAVVNSREQQEMLRSYEQQQQQQHQPPPPPPPPPSLQQQQPGELVRFSGGFDAGSGGGGFSPMTAQAAMSTLALGNSYVNNNMYQIQHQQPPQEHHHHQLHVQPHQLLLPQEAQQPPLVVQRAAKEEDRSIAPSC